MATQNYKDLYRSKTIAVFLQKRRSPAPLFLRPHVAGRKSKFLIKNNYLKKSSAAGIFLSGAFALLLFYRAYFAVIFKTAERQSFKSRISFAESRFLVA